MKSLAARAAFAVALLAVPALGAQAQEAAAPDRRPTLAVLHFDNGAIGRGADYEPLRSGLADLLITDLAANPAIRVVERDQLNALLREQDLGTAGRLDAGTAARIGKLLGVRHFIMGGFVIDPRGRMRLDARAVNTETSAIEHTERVNGNADDVLELIEQMARQLNDGLRLPELPPAPAPAPTPGPGAAAPTSNAGGSGGSRVASSTGAGGNKFQAVMLYSRALAEEDRGNRAAAVELYKKSIDVFPGNDKAKERLAKLENTGA